MAKHANDNEDSDNVMCGANRIAAFLNIDRRSVYYLAGLNRLPVFRLGCMICARKSVLLNWMKQQEDRNGRSA